jgi:hypothetical protein
MWRQISQNSNGEIEADIGKCQLQAGTCPSQSISDSAGIRVNSFHEIPALRFLHRFYAVL